MEPSLSDPGVPGQPSSRRRMSVATHATWRAAVAPTADVNREVTDDEAARRDARQPDAVERLGMNVGDAAASVAHQVMVALDVRVVARRGTRMSDAFGQP